MSQDELADRLASIACGLAVRVRDDEPAANARWLDSQIRSVEELRALVFVLAAAVPIEVPWSHLTAWTRMAGGPDTVKNVLERQRLLNEALAPAKRGRAAA
jgi:hypothetical protein